MKPAKSVNTLIAENEGLRKSVAKYKERWLRLRNGIAALHDGVPQDKFDELFRDSKKTSAAGRKES